MRQMDLFSAPAVIVPVPSVFVLADLAELRRVGFEFARSHGWTVDPHPHWNARKQATGHAGDWPDYTDDLRAFDDGYYDGLAEFHPQTCPGLANGNLAKLEAERY